MLESSNDASWSGRIQIYQILTYDLWWFNIVDIGHNPVTYPKPKEPTSHHCLNHTQSTNSYGVKLTFSSLILILETIVGWSCARKQLPNSFPAQKKPSNNNPFVSSSSWSSDANVNHIISNLILSSPCQLDNQQLYNYIYNQINIYIYINISSTRWSEWKLFVEGGWPNVAHLHHHPGLRGSSHEKGWNGNHQPHCNMLHVALDKPYLLDHVGYEWYKSGWIGCVAKMRGCAAATAPQLRATVLERLLHP